MGRYQVLNALQAFCSALAGMLSSRATLEGKVPEFTRQYQFHAQLAPYIGYGVGNASASATDALLLSVLQDIFGRMTSMLGLFIRVFAFWPFKTLPKRYWQPTIMDLLSCLRLKRIDSWLTY